MEPKGPAVEFAGRAKRALANYLENFIPFVALDLAFIAAPSVRRRVADSLDLCPHLLLPLYLFGVRLRPLPLLGRLARRNRGHVDQAGALAKGPKPVSVSGIRGWRRGVRVLLGAVVGLQGAAAFAEQNGPPPPLATMRAAFAKAVAAKNIASVEALTSFPLKNVVENEPALIPQSAFAKSFSLNNYADMAGCLKTSPLERSPKRGAWLVNCDGNMFYFGLHNGQWRHTEYENVNE